MIDMFVLLAGARLRLLCCRRRLLFENLALRQQLVALNRTRPRPRLALFDKLLWDWLPVVLGADFQSAKAAWAKADSERSSGINLSHGGRESNVGSAAHPR